MPSKLSQSHSPDVSQLKKMMNNRKMANLSVSTRGSLNGSSGAQHQILQVGLPGVPVIGNMIQSTSGNGVQTLHFPVSRKGSSSGGTDIPTGISHHAHLHHSHHRIPSDPEVARMITFGSMPSYREDKMQELKRHKDSLMRSKSIESNLSPPSDGQSIMMITFYFRLSFPFCPFRCYRTDLVIKKAIDCLIIRSVTM